MRTVYGQAFLESSRTVHPRVRSSRCFDWCLPTLCAGVCCRRPQTEPPCRRRGRPPSEPQSPTVARYHRRFCRLTGRSAATAEMAQLSFGAYSLPISSGRITGAFWSPERATLRTKSVSHLDASGCCDGACDFPPALFLHHISVLRSGFALQCMNRPGHNQSIAPVIVT